MTDNKTTLEQLVKKCAYCKAGDMETCENCETKGCPECSEGWRMDSEGCWLCPECYSALKDCPDFYPIEDCGKHYDSLAQFVSENLPNYDKQLAQAREEWYRDTGNQSDYEHIQSWSESMLNEALEAFARHVWDQACREQREICAQAYIDYNGEEFDYETVSEAIYEALTPEFKLTENEYE